MDLQCTEAFLKVHSRHVSIKLCYRYCTCIFSGCDAKLRFANSFGDGMVLQRAPQSAILWGYSEVIGDTITIIKNGVVITNTTSFARPSNCKY